MIEKEIILTKEQAENANQWIIKQTEPRQKTQSMNGYIYKTGTTYNDWEYKQQLGNSHTLKWLEEKDTEAKINEKLSDWKFKNLLDDNQIKYLEEILEKSSASYHNADWAYSLSGNDEKRSKSSASIDIHDRRIDDPNGTLIVEGNLEVKKKLTVNDTSELIGATTLKSTLNVADATSIESTLNVTDATTLKSTLNVADATSIESTLNVTDATTLQSSLGVTGATTLESTLNVADATTLQSSLGVTGATTLKDTLKVEGIAYLQENTTIGTDKKESNLDVKGEIYNKRIPTNTYKEGNELADKEFVNSSIETATATFRGSNEPKDYGYELVSDPGIEVKEYRTLGSVPYPYIEKDEIFKITNEKEAGFYKKNETDWTQISEMITFLNNKEKSKPAQKKADKNDYCFFQIWEKVGILPYVLFTDKNDSQSEEQLKEIRIIVYKFKFVQAENPDDSTWDFEYQLNHSGFTKAQWDAITSGITSGWISKTEEDISKRLLYTDFNGNLFIKDNGLISIREATQSKKGIVSTGTQIFSGDKTFTNSVKIGETTYLINSEKEVATLPTYSEAFFGVIYVCDNKKYVKTNYEQKLIEVTDINQSSSGLVLGSNNVLGGINSFAQGSKVTAIGNNSHAEGNRSFAKGSNSHAEGYHTMAAANSHAEGTSAIAGSELIVVEKLPAVSKADRNLVYKPTTSGTVDTFQYKANNHYTAFKGVWMDLGKIFPEDTAHAEGFGTYSYGDGSHSEGWLTLAGRMAHSEGNWTNALGENSHAEGYYTSACGNSSHSEGYQTEANGVCSHAEGYYTTTYAEKQHVQGSYNDVTNTSLIDIVGNGESKIKRSNAYGLDLNGNGYYKGNVYVKCSSASTGGEKLITSTEADNKLKNYYTQTEVNNKLTNYCDKNYLSNNFYNKTEINDKLNKYYDKDYINNHYYTDTYIQENYYTSAHCNNIYSTYNYLDDNYYTKEEVDEKISQYRNDIYESARMSGKIKTIVYDSDDNLYNGEYSSSNIFYYETSDSKDAFRLEVSIPGNIYKSPYYYVYNYGIFGGTIIDSEIIRENDYSRVSCGWVSNFQYFKNEPFDNRYFILYDDESNGKLYIRAREDLPTGYNYKLLQYTLCE